MKKGRDYMLDKKSYKILKKLYKIGSTTDIKALAYENNEIINDNVTYLITLNFIEMHQFNSKKNIGYKDAKYKITVLGMAYIEQRRHNFWLFLIPYCITTLIAIAALFTP
jgi:hypothetical protein